MKVLITGATGFIGSHLVKAFCRRHDVTALVRATSKRDELARYPVRLAEGDLTDRDRLPPLITGGFDLVVHAAARVTDWGSYPEFYAANVEASVNLIDAFPRGTRMIFISSNAVVGEEDCPTPKSEEAPYRPVLPYPGERLLPSAMNHYRLTKALAEQMLIRKAEVKGIDLTVVRPVWVFGPREFHAGPYEYCRAVLDGLPLLPGSPRNRFHVIFVEDLARLVLALAENQPPGIQIFHAGHPEVPRMQEYWDLYCRELGRPRPRVFPPWVLLPVAFALELLYTLGGAVRPPLFTRARLTMFAADNVYATDKIRNRFPGFAFTPLDRAVRKTVRWWRRYKFLPRGSRP